MRALDNVNELESLASRAASGDQAAFRSLVDKTHAIAYRVALRMLGRPDAAEDVVQETYIRTWQSLVKLRDRRAVLAFICRIARNVATDKLRKLGRRRIDSLDAQLGEGVGALVDSIADDGPTPDELVSSAQVQIAVRAVVDQLKDKHRIVLLLREVDGMSYDEISAVLGVPVGTVESRLHRARKELAQKLERLVRAQQKEAA